MGNCTESMRPTAVTYLRAGQIADYALLGAALGHQCDDSQISMFWLSREGRTALQVRATEGGAGDVYGKRLRAGSKWETAGERPGARGNIEGR